MGAEYERSILGGKKKEKKNLYRANIGIWEWAEEEAA